MVFKYLSTYKCLCMYTHGVYVCIYTCIYIYLYIYMYTYIYIHVYIYIYIYICIENMKIDIHIYVIRECVTHGVDVKRCVDICLQKMFMCMYT